MAVGTDVESFPVCHYRYGAIAIRTIDLGLDLFESVEYIGVGKAEDIVWTATDNRNRWFYLFKKWNGAGLETAMMGNKKDMAAEVSSRLGKTPFRIA